jgi:hypothetical protein
MSVNHRSRAQVHMLVDIMTNGKYTIKGHMPFLKDFRPSSGPESIYNIL